MTKPEPKSFRFVDARGRTHELLLHLSDSNLYLTLLAADIPMGTWEGEKGLLLPRDLPGIMRELRGIARRIDKPCIYEIPVTYHAYAERDGESGEVRAQHGCGASVSFPIARRDEVETFLQLLEPFLPWAG